MFTFAAYQTVILSQRYQPKFVPVLSSLFFFLSLSFPANGQLITKISEGLEEDVNLAVAAAQKAFDTTWGLNASGPKRGELLWKLAQLMETHKDELAAIEALDNGAFSGSYLK
jgi:acyl-CoA reductase-like NAD-dependent aldehyde dehydrogenase